MASSGTIIGLARKSVKAHLVLSLRVSFGLTSSLCFRAVQAGGEKPLRHSSPCHFSSTGTSGMLRSETEDSELPFNHTRKSALLLGMRPGHSMAFRTNSDAPTFFFLAVSAPFGMRCGRNGAARHGADHCRIERRMAGRGRARYASRPRRS